MMKVILLLIFCCSTTVSLAQTPNLWLMKGHDTRRTGQSSVAGPKSIDPEKSWRRDIPAANVINVGASVDERGVYFGSWGLQRKPEGSNDPREWNKYDGAIYGYGLDGLPLWGDGKADLDVVHRCYEYEGRERDGNDILFCGLLNEYHVSFFNGTVEGQAAIDPDKNIMYVGRGDGKLYAINRLTGEIEWQYRTFNPELPDDPDGGGEVVTSPLYDANGTIYFATWGEGKYETNAIYAVNPDSTLRWRYPSDSSLRYRFFASPALSADESTVYFSTFIASDSSEIPGVLYAFDELADENLPAEERLKWTLELSDNDDPVFTNTIAVGTDGTIYVGGWVLRDNRNVPVVFAVEDNGTSARLKWSSPYRELDDGAFFVFGIALREEEGTTKRLYVTTSSGGTPLTNWKQEGGLYAVDPGTGAVLGSYDPSDDVPTAIGGINSPAIDSDGVIYFGVRGHYRGPFAPNRAPGYYMGVSYDETTNQFFLLWNFQTDDNYIEWTNPSIGPDGGIYVGSCANGPVDSVYTAVHIEGEVPEETTPTFYGLKGATTSVEDMSRSDEFVLEEPRPNPFSGKTVIRYHLARSAKVSLTVRDALGSEVAVLLNEREEAGEHAVVLEVGNLSPGIYFCHFFVEGKEEVKKMVIW